jgi:CheY-like chemotaxis protein
MGGNIGVESVLGRGSVFTFIVPFAPDPDVPAPRANLEPAVAAKPPLEPLDMQVLLAEDNPINQKVAVNFLKRLGCTVTVASNGREAVEHCSSCRYDVVIMDCQMPQMDGFEATRMIRASADQLLRRTPIIAMTANAMPEDRARCLNAGMDDYVSKPVSMQQLRAALKQYQSPDRALTHVAPAAQPVR